MILEGRIYKDGKWWLAECDVLDALTQGRSRSNASIMLKDWIRTALDRPDFKIDAKIDSSGKVTLTVEDNAPVLALVLQRQRQKHGLTVRQVAERLKMKTHSSYAQYERGKSEPSVSQLDRFLSVIAPERRVRVKVG